MDIFAAVGGIWASADDMSRWLEMLLADGKYGGKPVLDPAIIQAMEAPQMIIQSDTGVGKEIREWMPGGYFYTYGLGLFVQNYHGHTLVWHAGDINGMASAVVLVPADHLGIVVLSNMNEAHGRFAIIARILQCMLDLPLHDLEPSLLAQAKHERAKAHTLEQKLAETWVPSTKPPRPLADYAGEYSDRLDGDAHVTVEHGHLVLRLGNPDFIGDLQAWHGTRSE